MTLLESSKPSVADVLLKYTVQVAVPPNACDQLFPVPEGEAVVVVVDPYATVVPRSHVTRLAWSGLPPSKP